MRASTVLLALVLGLPALAHGQSDKPPLVTELGPTFVAVGHDDKPIETLEKAFFTAPETQAGRPLAELALSILTKLERAEPESDSSRCFVRAKHLTFDTADNYYRIVFRRPGRDEMLNLLLHDKTHSHSTKLNWSSSSYLCQVLLTYSPEADIATAYVSTLQPNPLRSAVPAFAQKLQIPELLSALHASETKRLADSRIAAKPLFWAVISEVDLPYSRASLEVTDVLKEPSSPDLTELSKAARKEGALLGARQGLFCPEAASLADRFPGEISAFKWRSDGCSSEARCCDEDKPKSCWDRLEAATANLYSNSVSGRGLAPECIRAILEIDGLFRALVDRGNADKLTATSKYTMAPLTHLGLGLMTGSFLKVRGDSARVTVDQGRLAADPLTGTAALAILDIHPVGYDADRDEMSTSEQFRLFCGVGLGGSQLTLAAGLGFAPFRKVRGLSINAGGALVRINTLPSGKALGDPPGDTGFAHGWARAFLLGLAFNFGS
jgi:hypothetical protein